MMPRPTMASRPLRLLQQQTRNASTKSPPTSRTAALANWAATLSYTDLPKPVVERTKALFLDWYACGLGGRNHPAVAAINAFARQMGPEAGRCEILHTPSDGSSPAFAAMVNGASSHVVEQDDLHNSSMTHPATVVFPAALAVAQDTGADGKALIAASVVGYEVACRVGEFLGRSHYAVFHTTATSGVLGAAAASAHLLRLDGEQTLSAIGTAGTQAAGLWQFLLDATHSKQVHTAKASFDGVFSAYVAQSGLLGTSEILEGPNGMAASMVPGKSKPSALTSGLGERYAIMGTSFKWHASCRHTHPSADGLLALMSRNGLKMDDIESVTCYVYAAAIDVLSRSEAALTVHQSKFSMGFVMAVAAKYGRASVLDFTEDALSDIELRAFQKRVRMVLDEAIDASFPDKWQARVEVTTKSGDTFVESVDVAKGDPELPLNRNELEEKTMRICQHAGVVNENAVRKTISRVWCLEEARDLAGFACL